MDRHRLPGSRRRRWWLIEQRRRAACKLPGARVEGEAVARHLGAAALFGEQALEGRDKKRRSPRIVHLTTHGFFLEDRSAAEAFGETGDHLWRQENPLLRSGLALAGANTFLREHRVAGDEMEDGLLTAEEVAGLDLRDADLVFLSACETGLDDVQVGEGVCGLRRAFVVADARTLIMSLWTPCWRIPKKRARSRTRTANGRSTGRCTRPMAGA
jgi:CHAT domain-containing protein